jgi:hypothetical protein
MKEINTKAFTNRISLHQDVVVRKVDKIENTEICGITPPAYIE